MIEPAFTEGSFTQPANTKLSYSQPACTEIPQIYAPPTSEHAPWVDLLAQISSLRPFMKELVVIGDRRFYSMEDCMDRY